MSKNNAGAKIGIILVALFFSLVVSADSSTLSPGNAESASGANLNWANGDNAKESDDTHTTVASGFTEDPLNVNTNNLKASNFGFSIPANSAINGILVEVEKNASLNEESNYANDLSVRLLLPEAVGNENKADNSIKWGTVDTYSSYGGDADLWTEILSPEIVNNPNFGVAVSASLHSGSADVTASIDHVRMTVFYTIPEPEPTPDPVPEPEPEPKHHHSGGGGGGSKSKVVETIQNVLPPVGQVLGAQTFLFTKNLKYGMTDSEVSELQKRLTEEGIYTGPITGYFGPLTLAGVKAYQTKYNLGVDGIVGPLTRAKLNESGPSVVPKPCAAGDKYNSETGAECYGWLY